MIILNNYQIVNRDNMYYAVSKEPRICPYCQGHMKVRDSKRRQVILATGEVRTFRLRRLKCRTCGHLHLELPDLFVPYKHYSRDAIEQALKGSLTFCSAENSTIYRWNKERKKTE